jgi:hypothetical protein
MVTGVLYPNSPSPWWTGSFMENPTFTGVSLSNVRVIIVIMCVLSVELLACGDGMCSST